MVRLSSLRSELLQLLMLGIAGGLAAAALKIAAKGIFTLGISILLLASILIAFLFAYISLNMYILKVGHNNVFSLDAIFKRGLQGKLNETTLHSHKTFSLTFFDPFKLHLFTIIDITQHSNSRRAYLLHPTMLTNRLSINTALEMMQRQK